MIAQYPTEGGRALRGVSLTADRDEVYFGYGADHGACDTGVYRVPVEGGRSPEKVADGLEDLKALPADDSLMAPAWRGGAVPPEPPRQARFHGERLHRSRVVAPSIGWYEHCDENY